MPVLRRLDLIAHFKFLSINMRHEKCEVDVWELLKSYDAGYQILSKALVIYSMSFHTIH